MIRLLRDAILLKALPPLWRAIGRGMIVAFFALFAILIAASNAVSYASDDPEACINCHIMVPMYASWQHSSHARVANCNDCHVPHDSAVRKYYFKANDGLRHSALFTLRRERQVIQAIPESKRVIEENCVRCHTPLLSELSNETHKGTMRACVDCHREVPHGRERSLSATPNAAVPSRPDNVAKWIYKAKRKM